MKTINPSYLTRSVRNHVSDLIHLYGRETYSQLSYSDKCTFAGFLIEASGKDAEHEFLLESSNLDQIIGTFKRSLCNGSDDDFLEAMRDNAINYFEESMKAIFERIQQDEWLDRDWSSSIYTGAYL